MSKNLLPIFSCMICLAGTSQDSTNVTSLDEVVITANKYPKKIFHTGKVLNVIDQFQLAHSFGKSLGELLNSVAGTTVLGSDGNAGTNQTVSIRGCSAGNVLILIDGIPVNDPSVNTNYFDLNFLSLDNVERIEILKGGQSSLYGSDAVSGVINIIKRKNIEKPFQFNGTLAGGSYGTVKGNAGFGGEEGKFSYSLLYDHTHSNGFSSAMDSSGKNNFDKDEYFQHTVKGNLQFKVSKRFHANAYGQYSYYRTGLDAAPFTDDKDFTAKNKNLQLGAGGIFSYTGGSIKWNYHYNDLIRSYLDDSSDRSNPYAYYVKSRYEGLTHFAEIFANRKWTNFELLAGADRRQNKTNQGYLSLSSFGIFETKLNDSIAKMTQLSAYASMVYKTDGGLFIEAGGRWNNHSAYGNNFTYSINPSYLIKEKVKVFANFYSAFKTPTLYQLFDPFIGNKKLQPEKSNVVEAGTQLFQKKSFDIRLVGFYRKTKNAIDFIITDPGFFTGQYRNVNRNENYGLEGETNYSIGKWRIEINYTFTKGKVTSHYSNTGLPLSKDTSYYNLYRIPQNAFNASLAIQLTNQLYLRMHLRTAGKRLEPVYANAPVELKSYYTTDLYAEYKFNNKLKLFVDLKNITDQQYFEFLGYNTRRFNVLAGITVNLSKQ